MNDVTDNEDNNTDVNEDFCRWATDREGPVALVLRQRLLPVEGPGGVIFPPTYAGIGYNIDETPEGEKIAMIDSVGSQANRIEPIFNADSPDADERITKLVPQISITWEPDDNGKKSDDNGEKPDDNGEKPERKVSIFDVGHRLGDAIIRCTNLQEEAHTALEEMGKNGNAERIARLAPTSLVFGVWDSRDTQAKLPRLLQSVIRARDIVELKRSAQYSPAIDYAAAGVYPAAEKNKAAERGYGHVPSVGECGGVIAHGLIERTVTVNLIALRRLRGEDDGLLRRYILGLTLVAATEYPDGFLRAGCMLVPDTDHPAQWEAVERDGQRTEVDLTREAALDFAEKQAEEFNVREPLSVKFEKTKAKEDLKKDNKK